MSEAVMEPQLIKVPTPEELGFDPAAMRQKYAAEREKRLRADGNNQYQEITGALEHYNSDPYVDPGFTRPALQEQLDAVIVGGGFGGMLAAARLQKVGITNIRIIEKAGDFLRDLVLEPVSRRPMRHRILRLSTAARRDWLHPEGKVFVRAGDFCARPADRAAL